MARRPEPRTLRLIAALLLGAASVLAYAPVAWFPLIWLTLSGLFALLDQSANEARSARQGALIGAAFGFGLFITGVSWVYVSLSTFGGMPAPVAGLATFLFCCLMAAYPALVGALFVRFSSAASWKRCLFFAGLWVLSEWLRSWIFTGFPWLAVGYSQTPPSPLAGFAPVLGVYSLSLATVLIAALIHETVRHCFARASSAPARRNAIVPLLAIALLIVGGALLRDRKWTSPQGAPLSVALLQGNVAQDLKWRPEKFSESLRTYYRLALENPAQLTVGNGAAGLSAPGSGRVSR